MVYLMNHDLADFHATVQGCRLIHPLFVLINPHHFSIYMVIPQLSGFTELNNDIKMI